VLAFFFAQLIGNQINHIFGVHFACAALHDEVHAQQDMMQLQNIIKEIPHGIYN